MQKAAYHKVIPFDYERGLYRVKTGRGTRLPGKGGKVHTINVHRNTCTCEKIKIYKLPCSHILAVCRFRGLSYAEFVDPLFTSMEYRMSYIKSFRPIKDVAYWPPYNWHKIIANENLKRGKGRPRSTRLCNEMDDGARGKNSCSICRKKGHNKKTCSSRNDTTTVRHSDTSSTSGTRLP
ncbi:uncharacterized protein LOC141641804 [Silene latifolia]|uniref:uncharacterized protein LOC141641804 n=1 Tax=Silene latifolia TaxID=37657 RepID=UPI003D76F9DD